MEHVPATQLAITQWQHHLSSWESSVCASCSTFADRPSCSPIGSPPSKKSPQRCPKFANWKRGVVMTETSNTSRPYGGDVYDCWLYQFISVLTMLFIQQYPQGVEYFSARSGPANRHRWSLTVCEEYPWYSMDCTSHYMFNQKRTKRR